VEGAGTDPHPADNPADGCVYADFANLPRKCGRPPGERTGPLIIEFHYWFTHVRTERRDDDAPGSFRGGGLFIV
jgi:hypothetical protein